MTTLRVWSLAIMPALVIAGWSASFQVIDNNPPDLSRIPRLVNTCLITNDVKRLVEFYEPILVVKAKRSGEDYAELSTGVGVLAIFSEEAQEKYIPGSTEAAKEQEHGPGIQGRRCRSRVPETAEPGENLGQATHHTAMGDSFYLLS